METQIVPLFNRTPKIRPDRSLPICYGETVSSWDKLKGLCNLFFNPTSYKLEITKKQKDGNDSAENKHTHLRAKVCEYTNYKMVRTFLIFATTGAIGCAVFSRVPKTRDLLQKNPLIDRLCSAYLSTFLAGLLVSKIDTFSTLVFSTYDNSCKTNDNFTKWEATEIHNSSSDLKVIGFLRLLGALVLIHDLYQYPLISQWSGYYLGMKVCALSLLFFKGNMGRFPSLKGKITLTDGGVWDQVYPEGNHAWPSWSFQKDGITYHYRHNYTIVKKENQPDVYHGSNEACFQIGDKEYRRIENFIVDDKRHKVDDQKLPELFVQSLEGGMSVEDAAKNLVAPSLYNTKELDAEAIKKLLSTSEGLPNERFLALSDQQKMDLFSSSGSITGYFDKTFIAIYKPDALRCLYQSLTPHVSPKFITKLINKTNTELVENPEQQSAPSLFERMLLEGNKEAANVFDIEINKRNLSKRDKMMHQVAQGKIPENLVKYDEQAKQNMFEIALLYENYKVAKTLIAEEKIAALAIQPQHKVVQFQGKHVDKVPEGYVETNLDDKQLMHHQALEEMIKAKGYSDQFKVQQIVVFKEKDGLKRYIQSVPSPQGRNKEALTKRQKVLFLILQNAMNLPEDSPLVYLSSNVLSIGLENKGFEGTPERPLLEDAHNKPTLTQGIWQEPYKEINAFLQRLSSHTNPLN
ncbi:MAG: hypothetical protein KDK71_08930 [Chlamydiia bacterium]|nr:hypothetical protein [Chlamydiia bacterium]